MRLKPQLFILMFVLHFAPKAKALMMSGGLGAGQTIMANETTETEGPMMQVYTIERLQHSYLALGVEHLRSFSSTLSTSASCTGIMMRYYLTAAPMARGRAETISTEQMSERDLGLFIGTGFGFAQSSRMPTPRGLSSNAAGLYLSPRVGFDYQMGRNIGWRAEMFLANTFVGKGHLSMTSVGGSLYWIF